MMRGGSNMVVRVLRLSDPNCTLAGVVGGLREGAVTRLC